MFDIVYTYVNGDDPSHIQSKQQAMHVYAPEPESSHTCRFYSSCEIIFSLFSIYLYTSFDQLHKIYVVISDNADQTISFQYPDWIAHDTGFQEFIKAKLEYVRHSDIIPLECLPTFNSHVIELYLSNIPHLLETFVYFNDDCFLGALTDESFWFENEEKGMKANVFASTAPMKMQGVRGVPTSMFQNIMNTTFDLLQARFQVLRSGQFTWNKCHHQAKPLLKSACQQVLADAVFAQSIQHLSARKFRTRNDFSPIELMIGYMFFTGKGRTLDAKPYTFYIEWTQSPTSMQTKFEHLLRRQQSGQAPTLICINDIPFEDQKTTTAGMAPWKAQVLAWAAQAYFQEPPAAK